MQDHPTLQMILTVIGAITGGAAPITLFIAAIRWYAKRRKQAVADSSEVRRAEIADSAAQRLEFREAFWNERARADRLQGQLDESERKNATLERKNLRVELQLEHFKEKHERCSCDKDRQ